MKTETQGFKFKFKPRQTLLDIDHAGHERTFLNWFETSE